MKRLVMICSLVFCASLLFTSAVTAKSKYKTRKNNSKKTVERTSYNTEKVFSLDCKDLDISQMLTMAARVAGINLIMSKDVQGKVEVNFDKVVPMTAIEAIAAANHLKVVEYSKKYKIYIVVRRSETILPLPTNSNSGKLLTIKFKDVDISNLFRVFAKAAKINILLTRSVRGKMFIELKNVPPMVAMNAIAAASHLKVNQFDKDSKIYIISRVGELLTRD